METHESIDASDPFSINFAITGAPSYFNMNKLDSRNRRWVRHSNAYGVISSIRKW
jgi:hypothetical protein